MPEATPNSLGGAAPMIARALGDWKSPCPMPVTIRHRTRYAIELAWVNPLKSSKPAQATARPSGASQREPTRSASAPLMGATSASVSGSGMSNSPERRVSNPRSSSR